MSNPQKNRRYARTTKLMADMIVVSVEESNQADRAVGGDEKVNARDMTAVYVDIKITKGTNTSCDKAQMITATVERLKDMVGDLVEAPYVVHEIDIGTWGYDHATPHSTGGL